MTTETKRTLDDLLSAAHDVTCRECHAEVSALVRETFAAGAASRASLDGAPSQPTRRLSCGHTLSWAHVACPECFAEMRSELERLRASPEEGRARVPTALRGVLERWLGATLVPVFIAEWEAESAALRSPPAPSEERGQGDSEDEITRRLTARFRDGVEAAARILAGKGIDCRSLLDIRDPDTLTEIAETLAKTQPSAPPPEDSGAREVCGRKLAFSSTRCVLRGGHRGPCDDSAAFIMVPASSKESGR